MIESASMPSARRSAASCQDSNGLVWLYGGADNPDRSVFSIFDFPIFDFPMFDFPIFDFEF